MKQCRDCKEEKDIEFFVKNKAFKSGIDTLCLACNKSRVKKYREEGKADRLSESRRYYKKHPKKCYLKSRNYILRKRKALPGWLSDKHKKDIEEIYLQCEEITKTSGIEHNVDHIVPLRGKLVSGLHVPWNLQILTKEENLRKSNKFVGY